MNEDLINKITQILDQFATEEMGNRLSQFAMLSLKSMILDSIKNYKSIKNYESIKSEVKKDVKK
ncbi:hypothetical protein ES695_01895 [Candidatus Atribacteria bacterium 1244-E10-H5-B2]|nr:MAG: hypothetical protein ES695_01895 [Candidatus Atribacteria bacterium 1244-E10-H5-B2]